MTTFKQARAFLLEHRSDYDKAVGNTPAADSDEAQSAAE